MEAAPYATELMQGHPSEANDVKMMVHGECVHRVLGINDFKAYLEVIPFLFYIS